MNVYSNPEKVIRTYLKIECSVFVMPAGFKRASRRRPRENGEP